MVEPKQIELSTDRFDIEIEHTFDWLTLGIICLVLWAPCWWYDAEIRCALGNQKVCATMQIDPAKAGDHH